jgi:hypothetical protein
VTAVTLRSVFEFPDCEDFRFDSILFESLVCEHVSRLVYKINVTCGRCEDITVDLFVNYVLKIVQECILLCGCYQGNRVDWG